MNVEDFILNERREADKVAQRDHERKVINGIATRVITGVTLVMSSFLASDYMELRAKHGLSLTGPNIEVYGVEDVETSVVDNYVLVPVQEDDEDDS